NPRLEFGELLGLNSQRFHSYIPLCSHNLSLGLVLSSPPVGKETEANAVLFPPVVGPISQPFNTKEAHFAVDVVVEENTPIKAIADGTVIFSEWTAETGFVIILEHSLGLLSVYKHNAALSKSQGDSVLGGEVIATAGNTGEFTTGFHLHFELWMDGYPMNPENFFNFSEQ
ncbi:MAG: M23 family metallopeptidase, partial [Flavobacteriaceae bacterium]